jgi:hypothetical protein
MTGSGGGTYISIHTGEIGFGKRVSIEGMKTFWKMYGVGEEY